MKNLTEETLFELPPQKPPESKPVLTHKEEQPHPRLKRANRDQFILKTINVEELVEEDHPVRAIWEFVGRLDLKVFYQDIKVKDGYAGRSAIDPQVLICLWIYAYSQGVASAREIEHLLEYHPGYQWLTGMETINHHTLSDFRINHKEALDKLFTDVLGVLSAEDLITLERVSCMTEQRLKPKQVRIHSKKKIVLKSILKWLMTTYCRWAIPEKKHPRPAKLKSVPQDRRKNIWNGH